MSSVTEHGYVLIYVGKKHHLADVRGYAYAHRIAAEESLGRKLLPGELVHHDDEVRTNNQGENLIAMTRAEHARLHKPRLGTGSMICLRGHLRHTQPSGKVICRTCENTAERARYHRRKSDGD
jgi:HNH endonuclease